MLHLDDLNVHQWYEVGNTPDKRILTDPETLEI